MSHDSRDHGDVLISRSWTAILKNRANHGFDTSIAICKSALEGNPGTDRLVGGEAGMICIDTTVLIDEFRAKGAPDAPVNRFLLKNGTESLIVPVIAAECVNRTDRVPDSPWA